MNLLRKPSCGARLCLRRQGRLANRRPAAKELAWPTPGRLQRQSSSLNGIRHRRRFGGDARQAVWEWMLEQITGSRERAALPGSRHKTQNRRRRFGPGESSEGRRDAAWLAGETAGYPAKVPFRRPLVWRFCQKGRIVLDIRWKTGYSKKEFWQEANGKAQMLSQVEMDQCFENST